MISAKSLTRTLAALAALTLVAADVADARVGSGRSSGSRGARTESAPPPTNTAPRQAQPLPGGAPGYSAPTAARPGAPAAPAAQPSRWGGFMGGLGAGLLGAGLFGLLAGNGLFGGLGSLMSILGLALQAALLFFVIRFAITWFRRRQQPAMAGGDPQYQRRPAQPDWAPQPGPIPGGAPDIAPPARPQPAPTAPLRLADADFAAFEKNLDTIQTAYGAGDRATLSRLTTPEMANELLAALDANSRAGLVNRLSGVKLLQGDLSEAWSEEGAEYASVAMRYAIVDAMVERASGRVVEGDAVKPQEVTEVWTFARRPGEGVEGWILSAIQQV